MKRILVALAGIPVLLAAALAGGWWLALIVVGIQALAFIEWRALTATAEWKPRVLVTAGAVALLDLAALTMFDVRAVAGLLLATVSLLLCELFTTERRPLFGMAGGLVFLVYVGLPLALWNSLPLLPAAARFDRVGPVVLLLVATWLCDSAAYYTGRTIGGPKLFPAASPNKTWAGFCGGLVASGMALPILTWSGFAHPTWTDYVALPLAVGVAGQLGDLLESLLKRQVQIKDSSSLLPGHGGILDRFDSLLLSAPVFTAYLILFPV